MSLQRLSAAAGALDLLSLPLTALLPPWSHHPLLTWDTWGAAVPGDTTCRAALAFLHVTVGTLLPLLVAAWSWQPPAAAAPASSHWTRAADAAGLGGAGAQHGGVQLQKLRRHVCSAAARADAALARQLRGEAMPGGRAGVAWLLLASTWLCCRTLSL